MDPLNIFTSPSIGSLPLSTPVPHVSDPSLVVPAAEGEGGGAGEAESVLALVMSWSGETYDLQIPTLDRIYDLKTLIFSLTDVPLERIKLLGLVGPKVPLGDEVVIDSLKLRNGKKFMMLGTSVENSFKDPTRMQMGEITDDLDIDYASMRMAPHADRRNIRKIKEITRSLQLDIINAPRPGKNLLVLDLDYTLVDTRPLVDGSLPASECARPGLHEFLELVYPYYDLVIWSQTSWRWLEAKLVELGMLGDDTRSYRISFVVDRRPMFTVFTEREGQPYKHEVKALQLLWNRFPQFSSSNTIHIDDLSRNFALNTREGLKIKAFKNVAIDAAAGADRELPMLGDYLVRLAQLNDFRQVDHGKDWPSFRKLAKKRGAAPTSSNSSSAQPPPPSGSGSSPEPRSGSGSHSWS